MVRIRIVAILGLMPALVLPLASQAEEKQCDFQPDIVALADYVLTNRAGLPRFKGLRYGAISAFLKLRYGKLDEQAAEAMLMPLVQARVSRADELMFTWAINVYGVDAASAILGPKTSAMLLSQGYSASVLRAAIVKEGLDGVAANLGDAGPEDRFRVEAALPTALLDRFDSFKSELGLEAEEKGFLQLAIGLAATESDAKAWQELAARFKDKPLLERAGSRWSWMPGLLGNPRIEHSDESPAVAAERDRYHRVLIAAAMTPERSFLTTYVNITGKAEETANVADTIITLAADKSGERWTMDRAWIATYLELLTVSADASAVEATLSRIPFGGIRHYDGSIRDVLDWMIAVDALKPYLLKQSDVVSKPDLVSKNFGGWPAWQAVARTIRAGGDLAPLRAAPQTEAIAAELLFAAGKPHDLAGFLSMAKPDETTVSLAEDFANRMDRICYGYLNFPAEAVTYPDTPLFRFD